MWKLRLTDAMRHRLDLEGLEEPVRAVRVRFAEHGEEHAGLGAGALAALGDRSAEQVRKLTVIGGFPLSFGSVRVEI